MATFSGPDENNDASDDLHRTCVLCGHSMKTQAQLLFEVAYWKLYYCPRCVRWFKVSAADRRVVFPIADESVVRALTWQYLSGQEMKEGVQDFERLIQKLWRKIVFMFALAYLRLSKLFG